MKQVIAYEGVHEPGHPLTWSTGAVLDGDVVINTSTGSRITQSEATDLVVDGHLTLLPKPIEIKTGWSHVEPIIVLIVDRSLPPATVALPDTGRASHLLGFCRKANISYYAFTQSGFEHYRDTKLVDLVEDILARGEDEDPDFARVSLEIVRVGLALDTSHPELNALHVHFAGRREATKRLALAALRGDQAVGRFTNMLRACGGAEYRMKYEGGAAAAGGFDSDTATRLMKAFHAVQKFAAKKTARAVAFLNSAFLRTIDLGPPRLHQLQPTSATLIFTTRVAGENLAQRVARYYELQSIGRLVAGEDSELSHDERVTIRQNLSTVVRPGSSVELKHRRVDREELERVGDLGAGTEEVANSNDLQLFGFQSGLWRDAAQIEVTVAPDRQIRFAAEGGSDPSLQPDLTFLYTGKEFMFQPAIFAVRRVVTVGGVERFALRHVVHLGPGKAADINAAPCAFVERAYCIFKTPMRVMQDGTSIRWTSGAFELGPDHTLVVAREMMTAFFLDTRRLELNSPDLLTYAVAPRPRPLPSRERLLLALMDFEGPAQVKELVEAINKRGRSEAEKFGWSFSDVRDNNTRREVLRNPELMRFVGDSDEAADAGPDDTSHLKIIEITDEGKRHLKAFARGLGREF
jgi:hypothetical protein